MARHYDHTHPLDRLLWHLSGAVGSSLPHGSALDPTVVADDYVEDDTDPRVAAQRRAVLAAWQTWERACAAAMDAAMGGALASAVRDAEPAYACDLLHSCDGSGIGVWDGRWDAHGAAGMDAGDLDSELTALLQQAYSDIEAELDNAAAHACALALAARVVTDRDLPAVPDTADAYASVAHYARALLAAGDSDNAELLLNMSIEQLDAATT